MEITCIIFLIALLRGIASAIRNRRPATITLTTTTPEPLCANCAYAHIAHGFYERQKLIACTFGGSVRTLKFAVSSCTFYLNRAAIPQMVAVTGFARPPETELVQIAAKADG